MEISVLYPSPPFHCEDRQRQQTQQKRSGKLVHSSRNDCVGFIVSRVSGKIISVICPCGMVKWTGSVMVLLNALPCCIGSIARSTRESCGNLPLSVSSSDRTNPIDRHSGMDKKENENEKAEEKRGNEPTVTASSSAPISKSIHKREGVQQRVFIEIPTNESTQEVGAEGRSNHENRGNGLSS